MILAIVVSRTTSVAISPESVAVSGQLCAVERTGKDLEQIDDNAHT